MRKLIESCPRCYIFLCGSHGSEYEHLEEEAPHFKNQHIVVVTEESHPPISRDPNPHPRSLGLGWGQEWVY